MLHVPAYDGLTTSGHSHDTNLANGSHVSLTVLDILWIVYQRSGPGPRIPEGETPGYCTPGYCTPGGGNWPGGERAPGGSLLRARYDRIDEEPDSGRQGQDLVHRE